jgi:signal transduction histidine kinase
VSQDLADHALLFASAMLAVLPAQVVAVAVARQRNLAQALSAVAGRVDSIVALLDPDGAYRWVNQTRAGYVGEGAERAIGRRMADVTPPQFWRGVMEPLFSAALQGHNVRRIAEIDYPLRPGRVMDIAMQPARDEDGQIVGVLYCATDVTDFELSRRKLERTTEALRASHQSLEQFVRIASHDLREPLNTITQFCSLLGARHQAQLDADGALYLGHVRQGAARMRQMMDDVLQFVRLDQEAPPPREPVELDALLLEVKGSLLALIAGCGARIEVEPLGAVNGHRTLLALLLQNLLTNAMKFVPPARQPVVRVSALRDASGALHLQVADNGIGIEASRIAELGTPFKRLHSRRKYEGTGLGLAICKRIAEQHGGALEIASTPGEGTTVTLVLPGD